MGVNKFFFLQTMSMQAQILNCMYVFNHFFFKTCLFIFITNAVQKETGAERWGAPTWIFCAAIHMLLFLRRQFLFGAHTHTRRRRGFRCSDSKNGNLQILTRTGRSYYLNGSCLVKKTAAESRDATSTTT